METEHRLTFLERGIVQMVAEARTNIEIAHQLDLPAKIVENHRGYATQKLNESSTAALVRYAIRSGIIDP